jgi:uncharacterized RDD family membrane protein YckC
MTCPSCGGELVAGAERCPVCDASAAPRVEGALAADPRFVTPPARGKTRAEPLRDIPGLRKKERTWRDEVQDRMRSRRQKRASAGLPLFEQPELLDAAAAPKPAPGAAPVQSLAPSAVQPVSLATALPAAVPAAPVTAAAETPQVAGPGDHDFVTLRLSEAELGDLPLNAEAPAAAPAPQRGREEATPVPQPRRPVPSLDDDVLLGESELEPEVELRSPSVEPPPLERPARAAERAQAAAIDAILFAALAGLVLYFTGRAARVDVTTLAVSWRGLAAYLGLLALFYAGYFTGTTGQTPGKLMTGLRVVGTAGRPPSYLRAMARALLGLLGVALAGAFLVPMAFDPARRALHDRLFRTRVVRG